MTEPDSPDDDGLFPHTRWSLVLRARDGGEQTSEMALEGLCAIYRGPVYAFVRSRGFDPHDAEDLTQGFFADLLRRPFLAEVDPEKGKFRSFLLASVKNYLSKERRRASAQKRGGGAAPLAMDFTEIESRFASEEAGRLAPDVVFDRQWALALLESVLAALEAQYRENGRGELFDALKERLVDEGDPRSYRQIAERFDMEEGTVKVAAHRLRKRYRLALRSAVARTVSDESEVEAELNYLMNIFSSSGG